MKQIATATAGRAESAEAPPRAEPSASIDVGEYQDVAAACRFTFAGNKARHGCGGAPSAPRRQERQASATLFFLCASWRTWRTSREINAECANVRWSRSRRLSITESPRTHV